MIETSDEAKRRQFKMTQSTLVSSARMKHAGTRRLFEYWSDLTGAREAPFRSEITANAIGRDLAAHTFVLENLGGGNIRFRLAGSTLGELFGMDLRGMSANALFTGDDKQRFRDLVETVLRRPCVGLSTLVASTMGGEELGVELMLAPLRSDFDELNRVLGCFHALDAPVAETAVRRCRIESAHTLRLEKEGEAETDGPLAGFADPASPFEPRPRLTTVEGGGAKGDRDAPRRRDHLRIVTEDGSAKE